MMHVRRLTAVMLVLTLVLTLSVGVAAADKPQAQSQPKTSVLVDNNDNSYGILRIHAPENDPVYVKIIRYNPETGKNKKNPTKVLYIRAGKTLSVDMPMGEYTLRYATGSKWYGEEELFGDGDDAIYQEADTRLKFYTRGEGFEITLQMVKGGNVNSNRLKREKF